MRYLETGSIKSAGGDRQERRFRWGFSVFYLFCCAYYTAATVLALPGAWSHPLRLAFCLCTLADAVVLGVYIYVFITRSKSAITALSALLFPLIEAHRSMMHPGEILSFWDAIQFAIPVIMLGFLRFHWRGERG